MKEVNFDPINHSATKGLGVDSLVIIKRITTHKQKKPLKCHSLNK